MKDLSPLRVIAFPGAPNLPVFAALEHGWFVGEGLDLQFTTTPSSVYQAEHFHKGDFEIAFTAFDNVVAYREGQGAAKLEGEVDFTVVMGATQVELSAIVAPEILQARDLAGRSLALDAVGTGFAFVLYAMLEQLGVALDDYERVPVGATPERWQAVKEGRHVGTITIEPFTSIAEAAGFHVLRRSTDAFPAYQGGIVAARRSWARDNSETLVAFIRGYLRGLDWTLDPDNAAAASSLLLKRMPELRPAVVGTVMRSLLSERSGLTPKGAVLPEGMRTVLDLRARYGAAGGAALQDIAAYMDLSFYERALASLRKG